MPEIDLLKYPLLFKDEGGKRYVFDPLRKKYLLLTPEELIRQKFVKYLIEDKGYPKSLFRLEGGLKYGQMSKRSDIIVYDKNTLPFLLIECKSYKVKITQQVFEQVSVYNQSVRARFCGVTNGLNHLFYEVDHEKNSITMLKEVPEYNA